LSTFLLASVPFLTSSNILASRHLKQTIYSSIVSLSTLTFKKLIHYYFISNLLSKKPPPSASRQPPSAVADNAAIVPVFLQPPVARYTAAQLFAKA
jgi:hypothetical protein